MENQNCKLLFLAILLEIGFSFIFTLHNLYYFRKADTWPPKLIMQLMPKQLIGNIGGSYLKNSKSVLFHPTPCEALESLMKMMSTGFVSIFIMLHDTFLTFK